MFLAIKSYSLHPRSLEKHERIFYLQGSDVRSLLGRSLVRAKATHYAGALADAAQAAGINNI